MNDQPTLGGYIALHRKFQSHDFWREHREFSRAEAWIDIVMAARWKREPGEVRIGNKLLICHRGEVLYSIPTWARRWGWTVSKAKRFLYSMDANRNPTCKRPMIELSNELKTTRLRVCEYDTYQKPRTASELETDSKRTPNELGSDTTVIKEITDKEITNKDTTYTASSDAGSTDKVTGGDSYCGLKGERLERFDQFWAAFDHKRGKADAAKAWKKLEPVAADLFQKILSGAKQAAADRGALVELGQTPKMAQGWLTGQRWEDDPKATETTNTNGARRYDQKRRSGATTRKADSVGRASGRGLPKL